MIKSCYQILFRNCYHCSNMNPQCQKSLQWLPWMNGRRVVTARECEGLRVPLTSWSVQRVVSAYFTLIIH